MLFWAPFTLFACVSGLLMDKVDHIPQGWSEIGWPSPSTRFKLSIALIPADEELLHETIKNVSTPGHADYGRYLDESQLRAVVKPSRESTNTVLKFLEDSGISKSDFAQHGDWIDFTADIETVDRMMGASFTEYREDTGRVIIRTQQYSLPDEVAKHVDMIEPTTRFPLVGAGKSPLGFMNPFLYSVARKTFQEVDGGGSKGCQRRRRPPTVSLNATKGWDPITGISTPDFQKLLSIAMQQQA